MNQTRSLARHYCIFMKDSITAGETLSVQNYQNTTNRSVKLNALIPFNRCRYEVFIKEYFSFWWDIQIESFPMKTAYEEATLLKSGAWRLIADIILIKGFVMNGNIN
ncbi:unnamed protein product [Lactuca virosa]|uniref:Uncharacterized protein n=1 Tax=Lactuca virosa TaxID=75947 RepID=A0AAU9LS04_9ASTR|nr:unnamed protein product [Lactuca virosa]